MVRDRKNVYAWVAVLTVALIASWYFAGGIGESQCPPPVQPRQPVAGGPVEGVMLVEGGQDDQCPQPMQDGRIIAVPDQDYQALSILAQADNPVEAMERLQARGVENTDRPELATLKAIEAVLDDDGRFSLDIGAPGKYLLCPLPGSGMAASCAKANLFPGHAVVLWWKDGSTRVQGEHQP